MNFIKFYDSTFFMHELKYLGYDVVTLYFINSQLYKHFFNQVKPYKIVFP